MFDAFAASDEELCGRRLRLEHERRRRDAEAAVVEAELERRAVCDRRFGMSAGSWLAAQKDLPAGSCRHRVQVAAKLVSHLPVVLQALAEGRIAWEHAKAIARAANPRIVQQIAAVQQLLVDEAQGQAFYRWKAMVDHLADQLDADGGHDPRRTKTGRVYCSPTIDGLIHLFVTLDPAQALTVCTELERVTDELYRQAVRDHNEAPEVPIPDRSELRAQALAEVCRRSAGRDVTDCTPPRPEFIVVLKPDDLPGRSAGTQHADDTTETGSGNTTSTSAPSGGTAETAGGVPVKPELLKDLCPDAVWRALWTDRTGVPLNLGRSKRTASAHQRTVLAVRDGGCVFPGCDRPVAWCDAHHVDEWDHQGQTDLPVLALLCRHHHGVTHRNGWTMTALPDQTFTWTTPTGTILQSQRHHRQQPHTHDPPDQTPTTSQAPWGPCRLTTCDEPAERGMARTHVEKDYPYWSDTR